MTTRRRFLRNAAAVSTALAVAPQPRLLFAQAGAGTYRNPILGGDHPDASPIRVGDEFYLTHSSFDYAPGLLIWHSRDLINWRPVAAALHRYHGSVWAPYLCEYQNQFYIYFPADNRLRVVHADHPTGPWSDPVDLGINAIDPAHIAESGRRFLYMAGGQMAELTADGLAVKTAPRTVLEPWPVPATTRMECTCLEAPKLLEHNGYYYLNVAEGGTAGPATSHSVISARSRHADGPWEFSPHNPVVHTRSREDRWMSVGHGRLVDTPRGKWYMTVHSYENGYRTLGRQLLLIPIEWTADGWVRVAEGMAADSAIPVPVAGVSQQNFADPSDDFTGAELGLQWGFWREYEEPRPCHRHSAGCRRRWCTTGQWLYPQPPAEGRDTRHPARGQRSPGSRFLFPPARQKLAARSGVRGNLRDAAQRARRLSRCAARRLRLRLRQGYASEFPLPLRGENPGLRSPLTS